VDMEQIIKEAHQRSSEFNVEGSGSSSRHEARQFFQCAAKFENSLANVSPILADQVINVSEHLSCFGGSFFFSEVLATRGSTFSVKAFT